MLRRWDTTLGRRSIEFSSQSELCVSRISQNCCRTRTRDDHSKMELQWHCWAIAEKVTYTMRGMANPLEGPTERHLSPYSWSLPHETFQIKSETKSSSIKYFGVGSELASDPLHPMTDSPSTGLSTDIFSNLYCRPPPRHSTNWVAGSKTCCFSLVNKQWGQNEWNEGQTLYLKSNQAKFLFRALRECSRYMVDDTPKNCKKASEPLSRIIV